MHCVKLLGQRLSARDFDVQVAEFQIRVAVLNGFTTLGMPIAKAVGQVCPGKAEVRWSPNLGNGAASAQTRPPRLICRQILLSEKQRSAA